MPIFGRTILILGVLLFVVGGGSLIFGFMTKESSVIAPMAALALIFSGAGAGIMKKNRK
jgi:hypothetical protein